MSEVKIDSLNTSVNDADTLTVTYAGSADDLRARGLSVAVHNDYRLNGKKCTFWLFIDGATGMSYKGEGSTDAEALNQVRDLLAKR